MAQPKLRVPVSQLEVVEDVPLSELEVDEAEPVADFKTTTVADPTVMEQIAQRSAPVLGERLSNAIATAGDVQVGALKGAGNTVVNFARLGYQIPGIKTLGARMLFTTPEAIDQSLAAADATLQPSNTAQTLGRFGEQVAETIVPGRMVSKAGVALASKLPRGVQTLGRMAVEGLGGAGMAAAQGSDPTVAGGVSAALVPGGKVVAALAPKVAPVMDASMDLARRYNVGVDLATATGSKAVRYVQDLVGRGTVGGALVRDRAQDTTEAAMVRTGRALAEEAYPSPVVPETAGAGSREGVRGAMEDYYVEGKKAYAELDHIAALPANTKKVTVGTRVEDTGVLDAKGNKITRTVPITEDIALPTDLTALKAQFKPIRDLMEQAIPPAIRNASPGYLAVKNILEGKDVVPAAVAEINLSLLKDIAREAPEMQRTLGQGIAAKAVSSLEDAVQKAVAAGGPEATVARDAGRAAWRAKSEAGDVLKTMREEPVQAFNQAVYAKDAGIDHLRDVAKLAPQEMPKIGRAYIEDLMTKATAKGGFGREDGLFQAWQNLGPETKKILFPNPMLRRDLDAFFLLATKAAENSNKSGSGFTAALGAQGAHFFYDPFTATGVQLGAAAMAKLLYSPKGVRLLTKGMQLPTLDKATAANVLEQLRRAGATPPAAAPAAPAPARAGAAR